MGPKLKLKEAFSKWVKELDSTERSNFQLDGKSIFCNACSKRYIWDRKSQLTQHIETEFHKKSVVLKANSGRQELVNSEPVVKEFNKDLCAVLLAADIPFKKLDNPVFRSFLEKYTKRLVPSESQLRKSYLKAEYDEVVAKIREELKHSCIWLGVDETTDSSGRFIVNILVGKLDGDQSTPHLVMSREVKATNNATITQIVMDALHLIWPDKRQEEIGKGFSMLLTDGVPYMIKAGKNLKNIYPNLLHITCLAHALNRVCEMVRSKYKDVDKLLASIKGIFKKATSRKRAYKDAFPDLPFPPEPNLTRWGTWLNAATFVAEHFGELKQIIMSFDGDDAASIRNAQEMLEKEDVKNNLVDISSNFSFLSASMSRLQDRNISLPDAVKESEKTLDRLRGIQSDIGRAVFSKMENVLQKNPDYRVVVEIANSLRGNSSATTNLEPPAILRMKFCPLTTAEVERSFSMHKTILSDRRTNFTLENLEMYLCCHYENALVS